MSALTGFTRPLALFNRLMLELCRFACILLTASITVVVAAGVFWRYALNDSLAWSEELAKYLMVWLVFLGAPIAMRMSDHVAVAIFPNFFPKRGRSLIMAILSAVVMWFCAILAYYSTAFAWNGWGQVAVSIGNLPMFWVFVSVPVGAALLFSVATQQCLEHLQEFVSPNGAARDSFVLQHEKTLRATGD